MQLIQHLTKTLGFPWHYIYLPRVAKAGDLASKTSLKPPYAP